MTWETIERLHGRGPSANGVVVGLRLINKKLRLVVSLRADVLERTGWTPGLKMTAQRGTAEHAGKLRLVPDGGLQTLRAVAGAGNAKTAQVVLVPWDGLPDAKQRAVDVAWAMEDIAMVVALPSWARTEAPRRGFEDDPRAVADKGATRRIGGDALTRRIMGDPPFRRAPGGGGDEGGISVREAKRRAEQVSA